ncbi:MAG: hypothetical protein L0Z53_05280 [Acidobacteriales bacterium]|nr:hypothetical protein [Terriglobales bacterium]
MSTQQHLHPPDALEARAAEQRRQLHNTVLELKSTLRERLDVKKNAREHIGAATGISALVGLVMGYTLTAIFTD